jgi:hypothetical protein
MTIRALVPFSRPVRPWDDSTGPDQVRGALNQLQNYVTPQTGVSVSSATQICDVPAGQAMAFVTGDDGSSKSFADLIAWHPSGSTVLVIGGGSTLGVAAVRTYSLSSGVLQLAMASGTYTVQVLPVLFT